MGEYTLLLDPMEFYSNKIFSDIKGFTEITGLDCSLVISAGDAMQFSSTEIVATQSCAVITVTLMHAGKLPASGMGHNWVLTREADFRGVVSNGVDTVTAAAQAGKERLQPILMTSVASLAGFFPLVVAQNAGANTQQSIGTVVFGGLLMGTVLSLLFVPPAYVLIKNLESRLFSRHVNANIS